MRLRSANLGGRRLRVSVGAQIIAVAAVAALTAGTLVSMVLLDRARAALQDEILNNSLVTADLAANLTASYVASAENEGRDLAERPSIQAAADTNELGTLSPELLTWLKSHPHMLSAGIADLSGFSQAGGLQDKQALGVDNRGRDWFEGVLATGAPFLGAPGRSILNGQPRVPYGVPVRDSDGTMRGVLIVGISLDALSEALVTVRVGPTARTSLNDLSTGVILAHADPSRVLTPFSGLNDAAQRLKNGERGAIAQVNGNGAETLAAFAPVPGLPWGILLQEPSADAFAPVSRMVQGAEILIASAVALAIVLGMGLAVRISRPLVRLRGAAEAMADGDLARRTDFAGQDEIGDVGRAFDRMADRLQRMLIEQQQSEERYRLLVELSPQPVLVHVDGLIRYANPAALSFLGAAALAQVVGGPISVFTSNLEGDGEVGALIERQLRTLDGRLVVAELAAIPTTYEGQPAVQLALRDLTARKESERQQLALAQSEKMRALGQMASGIAHDLNQSLMLVASYGELALRALDAPTPDIAELRELVATATQGALDGGETVKRLLLFTRAPMETDRVPVDLTSVVRDTVQLTAPRWRDNTQAEGRPVTLLVETDGHPIVEGSSGRIREIMTNLIFNAVDALPTGGTIRINVRSEDDQAVVEISDSGLGMSAEVQARIFEPFFTTKGKAGTGLGLAMVFGIVEQFGGRIAVTSAPGKGTTFRICLPSLVGAEKPVVQPAPVQSREPRRLRVLTVDDEPSMTRAVVRMLRPAGHHVATAASGEEALDKLATETFDVILSDMGMGPGINGWELATLVRERWPTIRFLLATGWGAAIDPDEARARGVEAVLSKPYRPADLDRALAA